MPKKTTDSLTLEEIEAARQAKEREKKKAEQDTDSKPDPAPPVIPPDNGPVTPPQVDNNDLVIVTGDPANPITIIVPDGAIVPFEDPVDDDPVPVNPQPEENVNGDTDSNTK